jgi:hypothetical protein
MEGFKKLVRTLDERVQKLEKDVDSIQGRQTVSESMHYTSSTSECGTIPLDDLDTYRFLYQKQTNPSLPAYDYTLLNPCQDLIEYQAENQQSPGRVYCNTLHSSFPPELVETNVYMGRTATGGHTNLPPKLKKFFDDKVWEIESAKDQNEMSYCQSDYPLYKFKRIIKVAFEHSYETIPHVSFHITPFDTFESMLPPYNSKQMSCFKRPALECHIQDITTTYVEFLIYINVRYPKLESVLHWHAQGMLSSKVQHADLLSS